MAGTIGPNTAALVDLILRAKPHPEQGFRACIGIVRLAKPHGRDALEAACLRAREIGGLSYSSIKSILCNNLHRRRPETPAEGPAIIRTCSHSVCLPSGARLGSIAVGCPTTIIDSSGKKPAMRC